MQPREWKIRIDDMIEAIERILKYVHGLSYEQFSSDDRTIDAVIRNFEVLGEAAGKLPPQVLTAHAEIPWSKIRGMRNLLAHEYFGVDHSILWTTATADLDPLLPLLKIILTKAKN